MTSRYVADQQLLTVELSRKEWREIKAVIGDLWSGPQDVLWDTLDQMDLGDEPASQPSALL